MKKSLLILFFFPLSLLSFAQGSDFCFPGGDYKSSLQIDLNYEFGSNSITNKFLNTYLYGDYITKDEKEKMFSNLKPHNTFGAGQQGGLTFIMFPDTFAGCADLGLFVRYNRYYHLDMSFTDDLTELYFDGNKRFAGKTADIGNSSLSIIKYEQLQLGIISKFGDGQTKHTFGAGLSINNGYKNSITEIYNGSLYTQKYGEFIDFSADYSVFRSDTSSDGSRLFKGSGTSLNLYYSFVRENKNQFNFQITDFGFIRWRRNAQSISKDTTFRFEGVQVNDILNIDGNIFEDADPDSIVNPLIFSDTSVAYTMFTPACLSISYLYYMTDKLRAEFSVKKKFFAHYDPYLMLKTQYVPDSRNIFSVALGCGGYGTVRILENNFINVGIEYAHKFGKGLCFVIGTNYLNCLLMPETATSQGAFFSVKKYFY